MGYTSAQGNTAYVSDAMPAASLNLYTSNDFDFDPACFTELNMLNLELARRDLDAARERVAAMGCADAPAGKVALATVLLGAGQPNGRGAPWRKPPRRHGSNASARWTIRRWPTATCCTSCWACPTPPWQTPWNCSAARLASPVGRIRTTPTTSPTWRTSRITCRKPRPRRGARSARRPAACQATLGWIRFLRGDAAGGLDMLKRGYAAHRAMKMVADYGLALWRDGQQALARRIWDQAEAQCVWGRRLYDALRAVDYPHPLFHASGSAVQAYQQRCAQPADPRQTPSARRGRLRRTAPAIPARGSSAGRASGSRPRQAPCALPDRRRSPPERRQHLFRRDAVDARADDVGHDINGARTLPEPFGVGLVEHAHVRHATPCAICEDRSHWRRSGARAASAPTAPEWSGNTRSGIPDGAGC